MAPLYPLSEREPTCIYLVWVVGPEPEEQVRRAIPDSGWCGIGGRWTGHLALKPGAEGKVYGHTVSSLEAGIATVSPGLQLGSVEPGTGVDQARLCDIDTSTTTPPGGLVIDSVAYRAFEDDPQGLAHLIARGLGVELSEQEETPLQEGLAQWSARAAALLTEQLDKNPNAMVTVVDVHE